MKKESIFLILVIILIIGLGFSYSEVLKIKKENTETKKENEAMSLKFQRAQDYQEIQNVFAAHSYHYEAQAQWEEIQNFWSKREDIAYGSHTKGRQAVIDYYHGTNESAREAKLELMSELYPDIKNIPENDGIGDMVIHLATTPYVVIAEDGQTAKGIWYGPSICVEIGIDGEPVPSFIFEKDEADFIKEDGQWKIWHYQQWPEFSTVLDKSVVDGSKPGPGRTASLISGEGMMPRMDPGEGMPQMEPGEGMPEPGRMGGGAEAYSARRIAQWMPALPQPYETWDDSLSCVGE